MSRYKPQIFPSRSAKSVCIAKLLWAVADDGAVIQLAALIEGGRILDRAVHLFDLTLVLGIVKVC